jgi:hypothetical protein
MKETFPELIRRLAIAHYQRKLNEGLCSLPENIKFVQLPKVS